MMLLEVTERRKLPVWRTVRACYATGLQNLRQLVRISWLWLLIMVPIYATVHWLVSTVWATDAILMMPLWVGEIVLRLPVVVELPFLASIAVAWHRLVLRHECISASAYLRLDAPVWLYALCSLGFLALTIGPVMCAPDLAGQLTGMTPHFDVSILSWDAALLSLLIFLALLGLALVASILLLPRLSLVLPALALGERLSLWDAWVATRSNTLRLALATGLCMLPAQFLMLLMLLPSWLLQTPFPQSTDMQAETTGPSLIEQILDSIGYAIFASLAYALLAILAVTLLSLTYRFFVAPRDNSVLPRP